MDHVHCTRLRGRSQHKYQLVLFLNHTLEKERPSVKLNQYNGSPIYGNICQYMGIYVNIWE